MVTRNLQRSIQFAIGSAIFLLSLCGSCLPTWADESVPLPVFEKRVSDSLAMRAAGALVEADQASLQSAQDRAGPEGYTSSLLGPRHDIVTNGTSRSFFRFSQEVGVRIPILGAAELQQQAIVMASAERAMGGVELESTRQQLLGKVRENYINYWAARQQERVAQAFVGELNTDASAVRALQKNGFWTNADELRYKGLVEDAKIDFARAQVQEQNALLQLAAVTSSHVSPFMPVQPAFGSCATTAVDAVPSAFRSDVELAKLTALTDEAQSLSHLQRFTGVNASFGIGLAGLADAPGGLGYALVVGFNFDYPMHHSQIQADETRHLVAQLQQYDLLTQQRRADLTTQVQAAVANRNQAAAEFAQAQRDVAALEEDVREARVRQKSIAPTTLTETQAKAEPAYRARLTVIQDEAAVLLRINDLLQLAPAAC